MGINLKTIQKKTNGINFKILISFLAIISIIFFLIWLLEIILFQPIYKKIQTNQVNNVNNEIVKNYPNYEFDDYIKLSIKNNCNILIFKVSGSSANILVNTTRNVDTIELNIIINELINNLGTKTTTTYQSTSKGYDTINVGEVGSFNEENIYFYTGAVLTPINGFIQVSTAILLIITLASLAIAIVVSIILSKKISKPIQNISNEAKKLSTGDLDITFNEKGYNEIEDLSNTLNYSIEEIKKSQKLQKEVIQNVSHELRTPLTLIESYAELINDFSGDNPKKRKQHTDIILEESKKLESLINDMLDLSKMQANTIEYNMEEFNLSKSIEKFETFYKNKYKDFDFKFSYPKNCNIYADPKRIEQVMINLINNAINYSQKDDKKIIITLKKTEENKYKFSVQDFGIGISKEDQKQIFDRHFRSISAKRAVAGSGIGLTIVKEILNYHKFEYGVESEVDKGSTFYFVFTNKK